MPTVGSDGPRLLVERLWPRGLTKARHASTRGSKTSVSAPTAEVVQPRSRQVADASRSVPPGARFEARRVAAFRVTSHAGARAASLDRVTRTHVS